MSNIRWPAWLKPAAALLFTLLLTSACAFNAISDEEAQAGWEKSAHGDAGATAFNRWNNDDPPVIPIECAGCHSTPGFLDRHGADGSAAGVVDQPAPVGTTVECEACHNELIAERTSSTMPSGLTVTHAGGNTSCLDCHQGRTSGLDVVALTADMEPDTVAPELAFVNIHNNPAGPFMMGGPALAGYQYPDRSYAERFVHVPGFDSCAGCHDAHTLRPSPKQCSACHIGVETTAQMQRIRTSSIDHDGDGDVREGIASEVDSLRKTLLTVMKEYAERKTGGSISYIDRRPFFVDKEGEPFTQWTPRLLRAAYNYHLMTISRGAYAHNPDYALQLLYDSIEDLRGRQAGFSRPANR